MTGTVNRQKAVAIVLPHNEVFQAAGAGAVSSCVRDAAMVSALAEGVVVFGSAVAEPFQQVRFTPVTPASWLYGRRANRYVQGLIRALQALSPAYIEIHNRPVYVAALRKAFPTTPLGLYLHNDPHTMRGIREPEERARCLEQVSAVICVSEHIRGRMLEGVASHPERAKVRVVLNGVDTAAIRPGAHKRREITFIGRLSPHKGALLFAQAALMLKDRLPDWRFVLIGSRRFDKPGLASDYEQQVVEATRQLGAQGELTGYLPRMQAMARLQEAAIAAIPSQWDDPCPLSAIEAMASGCAVVSTPRGGIPELVDDAGFLVKDASPAAWADQLLRLAEDAELCGRYQRAARQRAVEHLDIHSTSARLDALRASVMMAAKASA